MITKTSNGGEATAGQMQGSGERNESRRKNTLTQEQIQ